MRLNAILLLLLPLSLFSQQTTVGKSVSPYHVCRGLHPKTTLKVDSRINEGSGLVAWNGTLWTHNDSGSPSLFSIDSLSGTILNEYTLPVKNNDWEELCQDSRFFYLGDIGNNANNRKRLPIYRINKEQLLQNKIVLDSITFEWPETSNFGEPEKMNFDCEAMAVVNDTLFLFTKEFKKHRCTRVFSIPAKPGNYIAEYITTIETRLAITGACYSPEQKRITLCGYNLCLSPRILSFSVSKPEDFKNIIDAKETRISRSFRQIEGIASFNGIDYFLISEATHLILWQNKPLLYKVKSKQ
jgi:hypothetical protein